MADVSGVCRLLPAACQRDAHRVLISHHTQSPGIPELCPFENKAFGTTVSRGWELWLLTLHTKPTDS